MEVKGIHHISVKCRGVAEFEQAVHFYRDLLGLKEQFRWGSEDAPGMMLDTGSGRMEISSTADDRPGEGSLRHIAFDVEDVDAFIELVRAEGCEITIEPKNITFAASIPPACARIGFCRGPVGEAVEFFKMG